MIRSRAGQTKQMVLIGVSVVAFALLGFLARAGITLMAATTTCIPRSIVVVPTPGLPAVGVPVPLPSGGSGIRITAPAYAHVITSGAGNCELQSQLLDVGTLAGAAFGGLFAFGLLRVRGASKKYPYLGSTPTASA